MQEEGEISIGKLAKNANVSVRTLQYYDRIGLLKPSSHSESGRRFYNQNDMVVLHQIITLKSLGLTLEEIKEKVNPVNDYKSVLKVLDQQSDIINEQISKWQKILESINMIKKDVSEANAVNWSKYSNMMKLINDNNEYYWVINYLDKDILNKISYINKSENEEQELIYWLKDCFAKAIELEKRGLTYQSAEAQKLANKWWEFVQRYTNGDKNLINQLYHFYNTGEEWPVEFAEMKKQSQSFMQKTIEYFLLSNNIEI